MTAEKVQFASRDAFREWLEEYGRSVQGIWLVFWKKGGPKTLSANEALEEALCFGWIDGQMKSLDESVYVKYSAQRRKESKWSEKNKTLVDLLEKQGGMTTAPHPSPLPQRERDVYLHDELMYAAGEGLRALPQTPWRIVRWKPLLTCPGRIYPWAFAISSNVSRAMADIFTE